MIASTGCAATRTQKSAGEQIDDTVVTRPGPRLAQGLANLARAIHPELVLDTIPVDPAPCATALGGLRTR